VPLAQLALVRPRRAARRRTRSRKSARGRRRARRRSGSSWRASSREAGPSVCGRGRSAASRHRHGRPRATVRGASNAAKHDNRGLPRAAPAPQRHGVPSGPGFRGFRATRGSVPRSFQPWMVAYPPPSGGRPHAPRHSSPPSRTVTSSCSSAP
jgi:hypothetical protein